MASDLRHLKVRTPSVSGKGDHHNRTFHLKKETSKKIMLKLYIPFAYLNDISNSSIAKLHKSKRGLMFILCETRI